MSFCLIFAARLCSPMELKRKGSAMPSYGEATGGPRSVRGCTHADPDPYRNTQQHTATLPGVNRGPPRKWMRLSTLICRRETAQHPDGGRGCVNTILSIRLDCFALHVDQTLVLAFGRRRRGNLIVHLRALLPTTVHTRLLVFRWELGPEAAKRINPYTHIRCTDITL